MPAFLFTDIESSTRLWEEHPGEMAAALERHDAILLTAITGCHGTVLKTTGDGAIGVFDTTHDAVAAALDAQRELQAEPWGTTPIRVRMGIHTGETQARGGDYFGPVMNRAARIMAAGHGNQVLLSAAAAEAAGRLPAETSVRDLGSHRLKDLTLPEHIYQLVHPDLEADFPGPRTLEARPNNLPVQPTDLVGRTVELSAMRSMLDAPGTRLLTVTGPGGAGKTRLSLQVAADLAEEFRDGVFFVDLSAETTPDAAFQAVLRSLALPVVGSGSALEVLGTRLRDSELLLVLDNFEQVIDAAPGLAELLGRAPKLKAMVTSREMLHVRGERVYAVPPLSLPDPNDPPARIGEAEAVQLFVDRATAVHSGFELTDHNATVVAELCVRLDGLPLAIELAAARLTVFTPEMLLDRIGRRLGDLGTGGRDLPDRQRTLWGAIEWSYELLSADERELFELLSVFSATRLDSVEAVAGAALRADFVVDTLASLVAKSLVRRDDTSGTLVFSMLQTIKQYAAERLAVNPEREEAAAEAHARYFSEFARGTTDRLRTATRDGALALLETEIGNLRTAWRYWVERRDYERLRAMLDPTWTLLDARGWYHEAIGLAGDMLDAMQATAPSAARDVEELTLRTSLARAMMAVHGYNLEVEQAFQRALELATGSGSEPERVSVLRGLASYHIQTGNPQQALEIGRELLEIGVATGDEAVEIDGHGVIGNALLYVDTEGCLAHYAHVIERYDPHRHGAKRYRLGPNTGVVARIGSAMMLWESGRLDSAVRSARSAVDFARGIEHPYSLAWAFYHFGFLAVGRGNIDDCLDAARRLAAIADDHDYILWRTLATVLEGVGRTALGEHEEGLALTEKGVDLYQGLAPPPVFWPLVLALRAGVYAMAGDPSRALELTDEAVALWAASGVVPPELWVRRADLLQLIGGQDDSEIEALYERASSEAEGMGFALAQLKAATRLVELRRRLGRVDDGTTQLARLLDAFTEGAQERDVVAARQLLD